MELAKRKPNRLEAFDYASDGTYFITICTENRKCILSRITVGATIGRPPEVAPTKIGQCVNDAIISISSHYAGVFVDRYVIMPNHVHLLLRIDNGGRPMAAPTVSRIINHTKGFVSKQCGISVWQKGFYDHIIRDERDYLIRAKYIEDNPAKWMEDDYYSSEA